MCYLNNSKTHLFVFFCLIIFIVIEQTISRHHIFIALNIDVLDKSLQCCILNISPTEWSNLRLLAFGMWIRVYVNSHLSWICNIWKHIRRNDNTFIKCECMRVIQNSQLVQYQPWWPSSNTIVFPFPNYTKWACIVFQVQPLLKFIRKSAVACEHLKIDRSICYTWEKQIYFEHAKIRVSLRTDIYQFEFVRSCYSDT